MISHFAANSEKCRKYTFLGGSAQIITISHGGVIEIYYNITWGGGLPNLLQYYKGGGSLGTPNLYYVIYGRPLTIAMADHWNAAQDFLRFIFAPWLKDLVGKLFT